MSDNQNNETASGAGYDRLMNRMKSDSRPVVQEQASFAPKKVEAEQANTRAEFGKRRGFA